MKDRLNEIIQSLATPQEHEVLTIYMPTHHIVSPSTTKEDKTRFKNLIRDGISRWQDAMGHDIPKSIRRQLEKVYEQDSYWQHMGKSLAIFASMDEVRTVKLPIESDEYVLVDQYFDLSPLHISLPFLDKFYVLALAMHEPKLYRADVQGLYQVDVNLPESPEDALNIDEMYNGINSTVHSRATPDGGRLAQASHGQGDTNRSGHEERLKFFRIIDNMILKSKEIDHSLPILIASTPDEAHDFRSESTNKHLMKSTLEGNFTKDNPNNLHLRAWQAFEDECIHPQLDGLVSEFNEGKNIGKATSEVAEIKEAVKQGRVKHLLLGVLPRTNDSVDDANVPTHYFMRLSDVYAHHNLHELARVVVEQGGRIIGVEPAKLATATSVAATYRY